MKLPDSFEGMIESKYLKKEDVDPPKLLTIASFDQANVAREDQEPDYKWIMHFEEANKPMVLNPTNIQLLKMALNVNRPTDAIGRKIVAYHDPTVAFAGKLVGGIRLRAPIVQPRQGHAAPPPKQAEGIDESDIPF